MPNINNIFLFLLLITSGCAYSNKIQNQVSVQNFGATPNDSIEDTESIQKAVNYAIMNNKTVCFPKGKYIVSSVNIAAGLHIVGTEGVILEKIPNAGKWSRMFTTQNNKYNSSTTDSQLLTIEKITFDGNLDKQGLYSQYELQQQHLIFLMAEEKSKYHLKVLIKDCVFQNSVADGIDIYTNVDATILRCKAYDVFRGAVVIGGGNTKVLIDDLYAGGNKMLTGIDIEVDGGGYQSSLKVDVIAKNIVLKGDFDVSLLQNSTFLGENITCENPPFNLYADQSKVYIKNSSFATNTYGNSSIMFPNDVIFENCQFLNVNQEKTEHRIGLAIYFATSYAQPKNQKLQFLNCNFTYNTIKSQSYVLSTCIYIFPDNLDNKNQVIFDQVNIGEGFDQGIYTVQGGNITVMNGSISAKTALELYSSTSWGRGNYKLKIDNVKIEPHVINFLKTNGQKGDEIEFQRISLQESQAKVNSSNTLYNIKIKGNRRILTKAMPIKWEGLPGDILEQNDEKKQKSSQR